MWGSETREGKQARRRILEYFGQITTDAGSCITQRKQPQATRKTRSSRHPPPLEDGGGWRGDSGQCHATEAHSDEARVHGRYMRGLAYQREDWFWLFPSRQVYLLQANARDVSPLPAHITCLIKHRPYKAVFELTSTDIRISQA